jgi:predicted metal-dependent phosphoesterase TrpH
MNLPEPISNHQFPLTIDECLDLMQKETADFERQLKKRQLRIICRLAQHVNECDSDKITRQITNSVIDIVNTKLYGVEVMGAHLHIGHELYRELLQEITYSTKDEEHEFEQAISRLRSQGALSRN